MTSQLALLRSPVNGLTYPPYLRGEPAAGIQIAYIARILGELGGTPPGVDGATSRAFLLREARQYGPINGRWLLLPFAEDFPRYVHGLRAVQRLRQPQGSYREPGGASVAARLETTARALDILDAAQHDAARPPKPYGESKAVAWLRDQLHSPRPADQAAAADALGRRGHGVADRWGDVEPPSMTEFGSLDQRGRARLLTDTANYVRLRHATGQPVAVDTASWLRVFQDSVADMDPADLYRLVRILRAGGIERQDLAAAVRRFEVDRLPTGLYRDGSNFAGDLRSSFYELVLRAGADEPTVDADLGRAVESIPIRTGSGSDPTSQLMRAMVLMIALGRQSAGAVLEACSASREIDRTSAAQWQVWAVACRLGNQALGVPRLRPWALSSPPGVVAAARLINGLADAGLAESNPEWVSAGPLVRALKRPRTLGNVGNVAEVSRAAILLGEGTGVPVESASMIAAAQGCPGLPDLVRAVPLEPFSCDLPTTLSVQALRATG